MGLSLTWITDAVAGAAPVVDTGRPALALDDGAPLSWSELREAELRCANALRNAGVRQGDRVGLLLRNSIDYVVLFLAIARVGGICVRLNWRLTTSELTYILNDADTTLLVFETDYLDQVTAMRPSLSVRSYVARGVGEGTSVPEWVERYEDILDTPEGGDFPDLSMDDPVSLIYTSGTTGRPKGVVWTHGTTAWFCAMQAMRWKYDGNTVAMTPGPLFHVGGLEAVLLPALFSHGTAVVHSSGGFNLSRLLEITRRQSVSILLLYSFMVYDLVRLPEVAGLLPDGLTRVVCGGDTLQPWAYAEFEKAMADLELIQVYGSSESGAVSTCLDWEYRHDHHGGVGRAMPLTEVRVVDAFGNELEAGEVGEIHVRGPNTSSSYWRNPEATAETFVNGWCRTGDLGRLDADGFLYLTGRAKDMIRSGGENVYPAEVEAVLTKAPHVADAAVFAVPDERFGEVGCATLIALPEEHIDIEEVREYARTYLASYKVPRYLLVVDELPRTASGKIKKFELRNDYADLGKT